MIISIRGTNGSGKSSAVREIMAAATSSAPLYGVLGVRKPEAYRLELPSVSAPLYVLGPYDTPSACGFDGVTNYDLQPLLIRKYAARGHVVFEGLISGKLWGRVGAVLEELAPVKGVALLFLDTPLDECIRRVVARRHKAGDDRPFNEKNLRAVYAAVQSNLAAVSQKHVAGLRVEVVTSFIASARCLQLVGSA
jgi:hypothetical protein